VLVVGGWWLVVGGWWLVVGDVHTHGTTDGKASFLCCPEPKCKKPIEYPEVELVLERKEMDRYLKFLTENYLRTDPNARWCPKPGCETPMIGSKDHPMMICPNPKCHFKFCFNCNTEEWHSGGM
jgi:hypothetical protein